MPYWSALRSIDVQLESLAAEEIKHHSEIRRIQQRRELLVAQRAMIHGRRTIYSLPAEVLLHIFHFCIQWDEDDWQEGEEIDWRVMTLSHVCSSWRATVLNTSQLWACLDFSRYPAVRPMIGRSKEQPVDVVHGIKPLPGYKHDIRFESVLKGISPRWRSLLWESTELRMTDVLSVLNSGASFPRLQSIELGIEKRTLPGVPLSPLSALQPSKTSLFPRLERICLSSISLSELPPTSFPYLRFLTLHFPTKYPSTRANLFRMSSLHSFLSRTPQLESLVFSDSTPLMDVYLRMDPKHSASGDDTSSSHNSTQVAPLVLPSLRRFEWSHAPPKDLWKLFTIFRMPALKELVVYLDLGERRWYTFYASVLEPMGDDPFSPRLSNSVVRLEQVEGLAISATDVDGLCSAFRRMELPKLERLSIAYLAERATKLLRPTPGNPAPTAPTPLLPSQETIFREPRMPSLTHLTLSDFLLERQGVSIMLAYMPNLGELTIESCKEANVVVCALSGGTDCNPTSRLTGSRWPCPRLQHLTLIGCEGIKLSCMKHTILARKQYAEGTLHPTTPGRPFKPLRKHRISSATVGGDALSSTRTSVRRANLHTVEFIKCHDLSQTEIDSLKEPKFGLQQVDWID